MVNAAVPVFVTVKLWDLVCPSTILPKLKLAGVMLIAGWTPLPDTATTALAPCELDTVIFPVTFSVLVGLKVTFIGVLCPAAKVEGAVIPVAVKFAAFTVT
jgi:hypothetical protein